MNASLADGDHVRSFLVALLILPLAGSAQAATVEVHLVGGAFTPDVVQAMPGDTVLFVNDDDMPHTVTSSWDDGVSFDRMLRPHESMSIVFQQAGTYSIRCIPHSARSDGGAWTGMVSSVHVGGASLASDATSASARSAWLAAAYVVPALIGALWLASRALRPRPQA